MRRRALLAMLLAAFFAAAESHGRAAAQADDVAAVLTALENALLSNRLDDFTRTAAPDLPDADRRALLALLDAPIETVAIRERGREKDVVLAEVLLSDGSRGRVANWLIGLTRDQASSRAAITSIREVTAFDGLIRLELDAEQFAVKDFQFEGVDFVLSMPNGTAFRARAPDGVTGLVLRGRAHVRFSPADLTEQAQLRIVGGRPALDTDVDDVFIRVNPTDYDRHITAGSFMPTRVDAANLRRAREIFAARAVQSYQIALGDLSADRWSLLPPVGGLLVDFRSGRFGWLSYTVTPELPEDISVFDRGRLKQISIYASPDHRSRFGTDYADDVGASLDTEHTALDLGFDPARRWISGRAEVHLSVRRPVSAVKLKLDEALIVTSVTSPEFGPLLAFRAAGLNTIVIGLPRDTSPGERFTVAIQYHGRKDPQALEREAVLVSQQEGPFDREPAETVFTTPVEPRFLYSHRDAWYPQTGSNQHATAAIRLTIPADYQAVATGQLVDSNVSESPSGQFGSRVRQVRTLNFRADRPIRYLAFLVTRLVPAGQTGAGDVAVTVSVSPSLTGRRRVTVDDVAAVATFYTKLFGDAPYPSLSVAVMEDLVPGGHSPAGFVMFNQPRPATPYTWLNDPVWFSEAPDFFLAHEVAHQWWGQAVGGKNYHELWTSEGFAQYMAWLYVDSVEGPEVGRRLLGRMKDTAVEFASAGPIHLGSRIGHLRGNPRAFRAIVYNKSAVVLHMLRRLMGDAAFFAGLQSLYTNSRFTRISVGDVEREFQARTSLPLRSFFRQWIGGTAIPSVRVATTVEQGAVRLTVEQQGDPHVFPLDVVVEFDDGSEERFTIAVTDRQHEVRRSVSRPVRRITIDTDTTLVQRSRR